MVFLYSSCTCNRLTQRFGHFLIEWTFMWHTILYYVIEDELKEMRTGMSAVRLLIAALCGTSVVFPPAQLRGVTCHRRHAVVKHPHRARRGHHPHERPYWGTCSRGVLLLSRSLTLLLLRHFGRPLWNTHTYSSSWIFNPFKSLSPKVGFKVVVHHIVNSNTTYI